MDQANSSSDPSQILILQFFIPTASLPSSPSLQNFTTSIGDQSEANQIYYQAMYRFWAFSVKHATQQKFESLRATFLPKLHNMVNSNSDFIQSMLNSLQNGGCLFIITTLLVHTINATISSKNQFFYFSQFSPCTLTCSPNHLYNPR